MAASWGPPSVLLRGEVGAPVGGNTATPCDPYGLNIMGAANQRHWTTRHDVISAGSAGAIRHIVIMCSRVSVAHSLVAASLGGFNLQGLGEDK